MTLAELKTLIQNYTQNTEASFVSTLDDFILSAEERMLTTSLIEFFVVGFPWFKRYLKIDFNI